MTVVAGPFDSETAGSATTRFGAAFFLAIGPALWRTLGFCTMANSAWRTETEWMFALARSGYGSCSRRIDRADP